MSDWIKTLQARAKKELSSSSEKGMPQEKHTLTLLHIAPEAFVEQGNFASDQRRVEALATLREWCVSVMTILTEEFPRFTVLQEEVGNLPAPHDWLIRTDPAHPIVVKQATKIGERLFTYMTLKVVKSSVEQNRFAYSTQWEATTEKGQRIRVRYCEGALSVYVYVAPSQESKFHKWEELYSTSIEDDFDRGISWSDVLAVLNLEMVDD